MKQVNPINDLTEDVHIAEWGIMHCSPKFDDVLNSVAGNMSKRQTSKSLHYM